MQEELELLFEEYKSLYEEKIPDNVEKEEIIKHASSEVGRLTYHSGKFIENNFKKKCVIREFVADRSEVYLKARKELNLIFSLKNIVNVVDILGFTIEEVPDSIEKLKYILVTQAYDNSFNKISRASEILKIKLLCQLLEILNKLEQLEKFHGALTPEFIYIDENQEVVLGDLFWSDRLSYSKEYIYYLSLLQDDYLAPEALILKHNKDCEIEEFDFIAADIFSVGLIILFLIGSYYSYNIVSGNPQYVLNCLYSKIHLEDIDFPEIKITNTKNFKLKEVIESCLKFHCSLRAGYSQAIKTLGIFIGKKKEESKKSKASVPLENFLELLKVFNEFLDYLQVRKHTNFLKVPYVKVMKNYYFKKFSDYLESTYYKFLLTKCRTEDINFGEGIVYFIREFLKDLNYDKYVVILINLIENCEDVKNYQKLIMNMFNLDNVLKDYVLTGLIVQSYDKDWDYFFPTQINSIKYKKYSSLRDFPSLEEEFRVFIFHPNVKKILLTYLPESLNFDETINNVILPRVYILKLQPSLYGLTTYNGNIFLTDFDSNLNRLSPKHKAGILLTLLHEIAHCLRRADCVDYSQSKNRYSPETNKGFEDHEEEGKTENEIQSSRGECGSDFEFKFLGELIDSINEEAAVYLLTQDLEDLNSFRQILKKKNEGGRNRLYLGKSKQSFTGVKCGFNNRNFL
jgi:hypothetical protein